MITNSRVWNPIKLITKSTRDFNLLFIYELYGYLSEELQLKKWGLIQLGTSTSLFKDYTKFKGNIYLQ